MPPPTEEELRRILVEKNVPQAFKKLESFLLDIRNHKYLLSSLFYVHFVDILATLLGADEKTKQVSWLRLYPVSSTALMPVLEEKEARGSLFRVVFSYSSFPPKFELPVGAFPRPTQYALQSYLQAPNPMTSTRIPPMFKGPMRLRSGGATVELSIYEYLFASLAGFAVGFPPDPKPDQYTAYGITGPRNVPPTEEVYQLLLQEYLQFFLPHASSPGQAQGPRNLHSESFLQCMTEFLLHHCGQETMEQKVEFAVPCLPHLHSVRRLITHLLADPACQALASVTTHRRDPAMLYQGMSPDLLTVRRSLFTFLRACLYSWPQTEWTEQLAMVVRCWLAFLQPWRAPRLAQQLHVRSPSSAPASVPAPLTPLTPLALPSFGRQNPKPSDPKLASDGAYHAGWREYVISNLPFYTILCMDFLQLLTEFNSALSPANVQLLQELLSLYTDDLIAVLADCEKAVTLPPAHHAQQHDPVAQLSRRLQSVLFDIDFPPTSYDPLLVDRPAGTAAYQDFKSAKELAVDLFRKLGRTDRPRAVGMTAEDERRLYTDVQAKVKVIFRLPDLPVSAEEAPAKPDVAPLSWRSLSPSRDGKDRFRRLRPEGREQLKRGLRVCSNEDVPFIGDVWQRPIASYELGPLIPLLHLLALWVDKKLALPIPAEDGKEAIPRYRVKPEMREKLHAGIRQIGSYPILFWIFVFATVFSAILWAVL